MTGVEVPIGEKRKVEAIPNCHLLGDNLGQAEPGEQIDCHLIGDNLVFIGAAAGRIREVMGIRGLA